MSPHLSDIYNKIDKKIEVTPAGPFDLLYSWGASSALLVELVVQTLKHLTDPRHLVQLSVVLVQVEQGGTLLSQQRRGGHTQGKRSSRQESLHS